MYAQSLVQVDEKLSDNTLIGRALLGDQSAFEEMVHRYEPALYQCVKRLLRDQEQALDVMQYTFLQLYRFLPRLEGNLFSSHSNTPLKSWLFQVAVNRCRQELRKNQPLLHFSDLETGSDEESIAGWENQQSFADSRPLPEELVEQHELQRKLYAAIQALPARPRAVVLLRYAEELSFGEIGRRLNMPENTAKSHFHRARLRLRVMLARQTE